MAESISSEQRKYYFGTVVLYVMDFYNQNNSAKMADDLRVYGVSDEIVSIYNFKPMKKVYFTDKQIHEHLKLLFNDGKSTTGLFRRQKDVEFDDEAAEIYFLKIREHYDRVWSFRIPQPNEVPIEAYD